MAVAAFPDMRFISGSADNSVKVWDPPLLRPCTSAGVFCIFENTTSGFPCPTGYTCEQDSWCPQPCPKGHYCKSEFMTTPLPCEEGTYNNLTRRNDQCYDTCVPGEYCPEASIMPVKCPSGTFSDTIKSSSCKNCTLGQICSEGKYFLVYIIYMKYISLSLY